MHFMQKFKMAAKVAENEFLERYLKSNIEGLNLCLKNRPIKKHWEIKDFVKIPSLILLDFNNTTTKLFTIICGILVYR